VKAVYDSALEKITKVVGKIGAWEADVVATACDD